MRLGWVADGLLLVREPKEQQGSKLSGTHRSARRCAALDEAKSDV
jgi:hypothetical protein